MEFPGRNTRTEPAAKNRSIILTLLLFAVVLAFASLTYLKSVNINVTNIKLGDLFPGSAQKARDGEAIRQILDMAFDYKEKAAFGAYRDYLVKASGTGITAYSKKGDEAWTVNIPMSNPIIRTNGQELLAADVGGREVCLISGNSVKWSLKTDGSIMNADLSESGHAAIVVEAKGYRGKVTVLDPMGIEMFSRNIAERFAYSATVSPKGKQLLINSIDTSGGSAASSMEFTDMLGNPFAARIPGEDELFPAVSYFSDETLMAVSNNRVVFYDRNRTQKWNRDIPNIYSSCTAAGKYGVIASGGKNGTAKASEIQLVNSKGDTISEFPVPADIVAVNANSDVIAVVSGREVLLYSYKGKLLGKHSSKSDIQKVDFLGKQGAVVVSKSSAAILEWN